MGRRSKKTGEVLSPGPGEVSHGRGARARGVVQRVCVCQVSGGVRLVKTSNHIKPITVRQRKRFNARRLAIPAHRTIAGAEAMIGTSAVGSVGKQRGGGGKSNEEEEQGREIRLGTRPRGES